MLHCRLTFLCQFLWTMSILIEKLYPNAILSSVIEVQANLLLLFEVHVKLQEMICFFNWGKAIY